MTNIIDLEQKRLDKSFDQLKNDPMQPKNNLDFQNYTKTIAKIAIEMLSKENYLIDNWGDPNEYVTRKTTCILDVSMKKGILETATELFAEIKNELDRCDAKIHLRNLFNNSVIVDEITPDTKLPFLLTFKALVVK